MSKDKYPSLLSRQMEAIVFILQIFFVTRAVFKIGEYIKKFEAHIFPRATLWENCSLLGTDNVRGQIS